MQREKYALTSLEQFSFEITTARIVANKVRYLHVGERSVAYRRVTVQGARARTTTVVFGRKCSKEYRTRGGLSAIDVEMLFPKEQDEVRALLAVELGIVPSEITFSPAM